MVQSIENAENAGHAGHAGHARYARHVTQLTPGHSGVVMSQCQKGIQRGIHESHIVIFRAMAPVSVITPAQGLALMRHRDKRTVVAVNGSDVVVVGQMSAISTEAMVTPAVKQSGRRGYVD